ncbi:hypothetical protein LOZ66_006523 [Ophidiomyces ophidiicola]|nr:hypothetical protein LOZ66_006523 [Ophidiomyces ophidiicola]
MATEHLSHDEFFSRLKSLFNHQSTSLRGSVFLTQKYLSASSTSEPSSTKGTSNSALNTATTTNDSLSPGRPSILIRASNGRHRTAKVKASTIVQPEDLDTFYARYAELCKVGMVGLKKRDRSARKKGKAKGKVSKA